MSKLLVGVVLMGLLSGTLLAAPVETKVAMYQGNCKGAYVILVDDGCDSAIDLAIPLLIKRDMPATFYVCPQWDNFKKKRSQWEEVIREYPYLVFGNHTYSHKSGEKSVFAEDFKQGDKEIREMAKLAPEALISFAVPGNRNDLKMTDSELDKFLKENNEVLRIDINTNIAGRSHTSAEDLISDIDIAEEGGTVEYILFHGIGGDWFNFSLDQFEPVLDDLAYRRQERKVWPATMISVQKYEAERDSTKISQSDVAGDKITVKMTVGTNIKQYDEPLTLVTKAPAGWAGATVKQGDSVSEAELVEGSFIYNVKPISGTVELTKK